jgi:hypothetical protein
MCGHRPEKLTCQHGAGTPSEARLWGCLFSSVWRCFLAGWSIGSDLARSSNRRVAGLLTSCVHPAWATASRWLEPRSPLPTAAVMLCDHRADHQQPRPRERRAGHRQSSCRQSTKTRGGGLRVLLAWSFLNRFAFRFLATVASDDDTGTNRMFTSAECQLRAEQKLAQAERDPQHKTRLRRAAEAWLILANQLIRAEAVKRQVGSFLVGQDTSQ